MGGYQISENSSNCGGGDSDGDSLKQHLGLGDVGCHYNYLEVLYWPWQKQRVVNEGQIEAVRHTMVLPLLRVHSF